jgi:alkaline phosphatase
MKTLFPAFLAIIMVACSTQTRREPSVSKPRQIIFLIGDGMGLSAVSSGFYYRDSLSTFLRFNHIGLIKTSSATHKITDSAAGGTAMATGTKTFNGAIGVDTLNAPLENITEWVSRLGWSTGVIATSTITHATPASFYAHVENRGQEEGIALQLLDSEIDFFAGGGIRLFSERSDGQDLIAVAAEKGFSIDTTTLPDISGLKAEQKYGFLLAKEGLPYAVNGRGGFLPDAVALALEQLSRQPGGYFLMVESSQIDWAGHENDAAILIGEMLDFENVIDLVLDYAEKDGSTLVLVTADHETGGFTLSGELNGETGYEDYDRLAPSFSTHGHSATLIPVFAFGPGAEEFTGIYENTELFHKMATLAGKPE